MATAIDIAGQRFGRLSVLSRLPSDSRGEARWLCACDCGNQTAVLGSHLRKGRIVSCGCYAKEVTAKLGNRATRGNTKHRGTHTRIYRIWANMKTRCLNPKNRAFQWYGGIGVKICPEWMDFENFRAWAFENGYDDSLSIDRINPFGNYEPNNCRWIPIGEQRLNQRRNYRAATNG